MCGKVVKESFFSFRASIPSPSSIQQSLHFLSRSGAALRGCIHKPAPYIFIVEACFYRPFVLLFGYDFPFWLVSPEHCRQGASAYSLPFLRIAYYTQRMSCAPRYGRRGQCGRMGLGKVPFRLFSPSDQFLARNEVCDCLLCGRLLLLPSFPFSPLFALSRHPLLRFDLQKRQFVSMSGGG